MAYLPQEDPDLIEDLLQRKEFYWTKRWDHKESPITSNIIPRFLLDDEIAKSGYLKLLGHQQFVENYFNPNTEYKRLHAKWSTGSGKTIGGLAIAMNFIKNYTIERDLGNVEIGSVFIIGFSERAFKNELLRYPEFGFLSKEERHKLDKLKRLAAGGSKQDLERYHDLTTKIKKRFSNRKGNGFFKFYGYKAFVNRIFIASLGTNLNEMSEEDIRHALANGKITYNTQLLNEFKNSLIICDEIHNVYNSAEKNNWGIAIQSVLDKEPTVRCVTLSATPLNNSPAEIVDLLNLLLPPNKRVVRTDFFVGDKDLKPGALEKIADLSRGRFSFLIDVNPKHYPRVLNFGQTLHSIPYLKFIRCPMSPFHYRTYKQVYTGALAQDSQYLVDFALPNPEDPDGIGIYQTNQIKKLIPTASTKWKEKYGLDFRDGKIVGDILLRENLINYSTKYVRVLDEIMSDIKSDHGKIFIFHNVVHMSGVLFIEQMLLKNGFLDEFSTSSDNTICMRCGKTRVEHSIDTIVGSFEDNGIMVFDKAQRELDTESVDGVMGGGKKSKSYSWYVDDEYILTVHSNTTYTIDTVHKKLLAADDKLINGFEKLLGDYDDKDLYIKVTNSIGKLFGDWLLEHGFELDKTSDTHSVLVRRGRLASNSSTLDDSVIGGSVKSNTKSIKKHKILKSSDHKFTPARFIMAHSDIEKAQMEHSLERFNSIDNVDGSHFLILVGSKIIKESYDIKALQNEYIVCKPDNIPTFIQIRGRAVRKGSHIGLPEEKRVVRMKIFTSCLPVKQVSGLDKGEYKLSYEEEKYKDKVASFQVIQKIEKVIHENAIDAVVNYDRIAKNITDDPLGPLPYKPKHLEEFSQELGLSDLKLSTFNVHHAYKEVETIKFIIKRLFIEMSSIWEYSDLFTAVKNPPSNYETELNTRLFTENNFVIALDQLLWNNSNNYVEPFIKHAVIGGEEKYTSLYANELEEQEIIQDDLEFSKEFLGAEKEKRGIFGWETEYSGGNLRKHLAQLKKLKQKSGGYEEYESGLELADVEGQPSGVLWHSSGYSGGSVKKKSPSPSSGGRHTIPSSVIDHLYDSNDKIISLPGGQDSIVVSMLNDKKQFYILFPVNQVTGTPEIDIELPFRILKQEAPKTINMNSFIQTKRIDFDYDDKKKIFFRRYADIAIENMENVVCEYGTTFHIKFVEECIEYVFRAWTDPTVERHEYHEFYFKMLYYYDLMSLVMWAYTSKPRVFKEYAKYAIPVRAKDIKLKAMSRYENRKEELADISPEDNSDLATSGVINLLKSTFNRTSNAWIPAEFREQYDATVNKSLELFAGRKKKSKTITKVSADLLPIGHYISKFPRVYNLDTGWDENPTYLQNEQEYKENNLIVGFDERSNTGVHIRFKIRNPIHNIKKHKDSRQTEKGTVCKSKSKEYLISVAKKLDAVLPDKVNVEDLCTVIRSKLIRLELIERIKKSNIKYFYFFYEQRPETR